MLARCTQVRRHSAVGQFATSDRKTAGGVERTIPQSVLLRPDETIQ